MNTMKVNSIKFLMNMFELNVQNSNNVSEFKSIVSNLVLKRQINTEVRDIVFAIYGITNTDVFKPNQQADKLLQLNYLISNFDMNTLPVDKRLRFFEKNINDGVKAGTILSSVRDLFFKIYDIDNREKRVSDDPVISPVRQSTYDRVKAVLPNKEGRIEVDNDLNMFETAFLEKHLDDLHYEWDNPHYDGCIGSQPLCHIPLSKAAARPKGSKIVLRYVVSDDGCHCSYGYKDVPREAYRVGYAPKKKNPGGFKDTGC